MAKRTAKQVEKLIDQLETLTRLNLLQIDALKAELIDIELSGRKPGQTPNHKIEWPEIVLI